MNKVATINLAGRAYQVEEAGYDALKSYLDQSARKLADDPDREEILRDLETAIAIKCDTYFSVHKNVVLTSDIEAVLKEMGPVDPMHAQGGAEQTSQAEHAQVPKRLYRIREGAMIAGVCNGIAAYLHIDVTLVRVLLVLFSFLTGGGIILAYVVMVLLVPAAHTPQERAAAYGTAPITAQELVDRARQEYEHFKKSATRSK